MTKQTPVFHAGDPVVYAAPTSPPLHGVVTGTLDEYDGAQSVIIDFGAGMHRGFRVGASYTTWVTHLADWNKFDLDEVD